MRLTATNAESVELGLSVGTSLADARAVVPDLIIHDHDPVADADLLDRIADSCVRYTPMVAVDPPDGILLDITGSAHLSGGEVHLAEAIATWLRRKRIDARLARASSAEAAHALARFAHSKNDEDEAHAIRRLPAAALELDPESELGLHRAGLKTIGDVADRPRSVIAARFGAAAVFMLERLIGKADSPLNPRISNPPLVFERRFVEPIASKVYALKVLQGLLEEAQVKLAEDDLGGRAFETTFHRVDGRVQRVYVETGLPTRDPTAVTRLFDERLDGLADPLDPGFGFDMVRLSVPATEPLRPRQDDIESEVEAEDNTAELLDRLAIRLGRNRVLHFHPNNTHIPENSQIAVPAIDTSMAERWEPPLSGEPPSRPLQLFDPPQRITVIAEIPDGPPKRFQWRQKPRTIIHHEGPERIAEEWWRSTNDPIGRDQLTRDYYRIEDDEGRRYWVFRRGLYGREAADPNWYLHGLFA